MSQQMFYWIGHQSTQLGYIKEGKYLGKFRNNQNKIKLFKLFYLLEQFWSIVTFLRYAKKYVMRLTIHVYTPNLQKAPYGYRINVLDCFKEHFNQTQKNLGKIYAILKPARIIPLFHQAEDKIWLLFCCVYTTAIQHSRQGGHVKDLFYSVPA